MTPFCDRDCQDPSRMALRASAVRILGLLVVPILSGCGESADPDAWQVSVEIVDGRTVVHNPSRGLWNRQEELCIVEDLRLGTLDGDSPELFGVITAISVSGQGDIAILDGQAREVRLFDREGAHLATFGRSGEGPGEFQGPTAVHFDPLGRIWVVDARASVYHLFASDGLFVRAHRRDPSAGVIVGYPGAVAADGFFDPALHVGPDRRVGRLYVRIDTTGAVADTLPPVVEIHRTFDDLLPAGLSPYIPRIISAPERGGDTWVASTDQYTVYRRSAVGDTILEIRVDSEERRLSAEQEDTVRAVIDRFDSPVAPPVDRRAARVGWQFLRSLHSDDDGRLFVRPMIETFEGQDRLFDVFDVEGRYLGRIESDFDVGNRPPPTFTGGHVYAASEDEFGAPLMIRGEIRRCQDP